MAHFVGATIIAVSQKDVGNVGTIYGQSYMTLDEGQGDKGQGQITHISPL